MDQEQHTITCELKVEDTAGLGTLGEQLAQLQEEPLGGEEEDGDGLSPEATKAIKRVAVTFGDALVDGLKKGDVRGSLEEAGTGLAKSAGSSLINTGISAALSFIPGVGPILGGLFSSLSIDWFQREGLVRSPTLAMVGEREPEFIVTQERMRGLLSGGRPGYGFGPGDFGAPNVNVASPAVNVEVTMNPGVDADIQTAYRARAGEARLSQLEG